jgi:hypothetical protein
MKSASSVKNCYRKDLHHIVEGTTSKILGVDENQADLMLVTMVRVEKLFVENPLHCRARHAFGSLYSANVLI